MTAGTPEGKHMRRLALSFLLAGAAAWGQEYDLTPLDRYLAQAARSIPSGFEVAIVQNGKEIYWKQFGPWPKDNQAKIASATKWFSGAVIMSLVDDGILSLDDRASKYLPYMSGEKAEITIRQLMAHTAGFPGEFPLADPCLGDASDTLDRCAQALARVPLQAPPGTAFIYAGADMQIAGRVAEVASGKDWSTLFRERIAEPLGMTATDYEYEGPTRNPRISGGARSTVSDYMKFLTMIRQRGIYNGRRILSSRAIDVMLSDQTGGVPIVESPFQRQDTVEYRYGIGNWVENPDQFGRTLENSSIGLAGWTPLIDAGRNLQLIVGMQNALRPFQPFYPGLKEVLKAVIPEAALTPLGVTNAASYEAGPVAPHEVVAVFGSNLGPEQGVSGSGDDSLGGTRVTFDGTPAPLLYAGARQVIAIVPAAIAGKSSVQVEVQYNGTASPAVMVPVAGTWPALFAADATGKGQAAAVNQDGALNSGANPAPRGSVMQLFATGACSPDSGSVSLTIGGVRAPVSFCGPVQGLPAGVVQIAATVPSETAPGDAVPVVLEAEGNASLPIITVSIQ